LDLILLRGVAVLLLGDPVALAQGGERVGVIAVKGVIDPLIAQYVSQGIEVAQRDGVQCLVIQLDTPGGSEGPMRPIVRDVLNSPVPIAVYVSLAGVRAASAGLFITLAAHAAAMASGTNIGAAHPTDLLQEIDGNKVPTAAGERTGRGPLEGGSGMSAAINEVDRLKILTLQDNYIDLLAGDDTDMLQRAKPLTGLEVRNSILAEQPLLRPRHQCHRGGTPQHPLRLRIL